MTKLIDIQSQIAKLQIQANEIRKKEFSSAVVEIRAKMAAFGITVKDLQTKRVKFPAKQNRTSKIKVPKAVTKNRLAVEPKYRGPNGETWSGRGLMPKWLSNEVAKGAVKEMFLIAAATSTAPAETTTQEA